MNVSVSLAFDDHVSYYVITPATFDAVRSVDNVSQAFDIIVNEGNIDSRTNDDTDMFLYFDMSKTELKEQLVDIKGH